MTIEHGARGAPNQTKWACGNFLIPAPMHVSEVRLVQQAAEHHLQVPVAAAPALVPVAAGVVVRVGGRVQLRGPGPGPHQPRHAPRHAAALVRAPALRLGRS